MAYNLNYSQWDSSAAQASSDYTTAPTALSNQSSLGPLASGSTAAAGFSANPYVIGGMMAYQLISGAQQAEAMRAQADMQRRIAEMNAQYAELDAYHAIQEGETQVARYATTINKTIGAQKTAEAAQGVDVNFGTASELQAESKLNGFLNQLDMRNHAYAKAQGYQMQAINYRVGGQMQQTQGEINASATQTASVINAANTGISGYAKYAK